MKSMNMQQHYMLQKSVVNLRRRELMVLAGLSLAGAVDANEVFPTKPITLVIPYAAGGPTDVLGRLLAERMSRALGQHVVVENRTGAGVMVGTEAVARAKPDGYTLLLTTVAHAVNATLQPKLSYDTVRSFSSVGLVATVPLVVLVGPAVPVKNFAELMAYLKAQPAMATYGSAGVGSAPHIAAELLRLKTGIAMQHIPYRGSAPALTDLMGGQIAFYIDSAATGLKQAESGKLKALAITSAIRSPLAPRLPTVAESGVPGYEAYTWNALLAPANTPVSVISRIQEALRETLADASLRERLKELGAEVSEDTSAGRLDAFIRSEIAKWGDVVRTSGMQPQ